MYDPAKSTQDNTLEVAKTTKVPENSSAASWAFLLELKAYRFYRPVKAGLCKVTVMLFFCDAAEVLIFLFSHHISHCPVIVASIRLPFHLNKTVPICLQLNMLYKYLILLCY